MDTFLSEVAVGERLGREVFFWEVFRETVWFEFEKLIVGFIFEIFDLLKEELFAFSSNDLCEELSISELLELLREVFSETDSTTPATSNDAKSKTTKNPTSLPFTTVFFSRN